MSNYGDYRDVEVLRTRIAELERGRCEHCGATLNVSGCPRCGAPVCCPQCCQIQSLADRIEKLQTAVKELEAHLRKIHDRAHAWNNIPACGDVEQMAAQALGLGRGLGLGLGRELGRGLGLEEVPEWKNS